MQQVLTFSFEIDNKLCIEVGEYLSNDALHQASEEVEFFVEELKEHLPLETKLRWHDKFGLTNISLGTHYGLDISNPESNRAEFVPHNLDWKFSLIAAAIAQKYVWELLKCEE